MGRIWAVCSGSGGVGKTTVALSLAVYAAKAGWQTIYLDASGAARCADLALGMQNVISLDMADVASQQVALQAALYPVPHVEGLRFACASLYDGTMLDELSGVLLALHSLCDLLVMDLPAGCGWLGRGVLCGRDRLIAVLRPDDASIRSTERMMSVTDSGEAERSLILCRVSRMLMRQGIQYEQDAVRMTLDYPVIGVVPEDEGIPIAAAKGRLATECDGPAGKALRGIASELLGSERI
ncbi:MAG: P-loop NTPase [Clostridia bacterium]|nr:P-loop NTPase [Clostridia bacterium]